MSGEGGARVPPARERDRASARERRGSRFPRHGAPVARKGPRCRVRRPEGGGPSR
ncbi:unnamed protein product, partial [Prorocentrum cordatum]